MLEAYWQPCVTDSALQSCPLATPGPALNCCNFNPPIRHRTTAQRRDAIFQLIRPSISDETTRRLAHNPARTTTVKAGIHQR